MSCTCFSWDKTWGNVILKDLSEYFPLNCLQLAKSQTDNGSDLNFHDWNGWWMLDVFHIKCLDEYCRQYPANTAPAGFVCPTCSSPIFPAANLVSPVADNLRAAISKRAWAREGLGLPLLAVDSAASAELAVDAEGPKTKVNRKETSLIWGFFWFLPIFLNVHVFHCLKYLLSYLTTSTNFIWKPPLFPYGWMLNGCPYL